MNLLRRLRLRARLAIALAGVAVISVALTTLLAGAGLDRRLREAADARLAASAQHSAELAGQLYARDGRWTSENVTELEHLAEMNGYRLTVTDQGGRTLTTTRLSGDRAPAAVQDRGVEVGAIEVAPFGGSALTPQDKRLREQLNDLHLVSGLLAIALGALAATVLAPRLARPLRDLTDVARRMQHGDLETRVKLGGGPEVEQVGHALNRLAQTLRRGEAQRRDAAADIAHELRTPLGAIVSRVEAAQDGVLTDDRANLSAIHAEALRLTRLADDLARLADAQKPGLLLDKRRVDLAAIARDRIANFADVLQAKELDLDPELRSATVLGDAARLGQVIDNLISNAVRYTDRGGRVTIGVRPDGDEVLLEVDDTGIGIREEDLPHVFERFWRGEKSRSRATGGAGIGLAIVRELVQAHDGQVGVTSAPGTGTRFTVHLPRQR